MPKIEMARLGLASEQPNTCIGLPRLSSSQGAEQEARMKKRPDPQEVHEKKVNLDRQLFDRSPVLAISKFLECFSSEGDQCFEVPRHVLEFLAASLTQFMGGGVGSLDAAFGGKTKRQRHAIKFEKRDYEIVFDLRVAVEAFKKKPRAARGKNTPFELAVGRVAEEYELSEDAVRRIYKKSKPSPL